MDPPETTTASLARTMAFFPVLTSMSKAPMQRLRVAEGVKRCSVEDVGAGEVVEAAKSNRETSTEW